MFDFDAGNSIFINVALFKISHSTFKRKNAHVAAMMNVAVSECGIRVILDPNTGQIIARNFTVLKNALRVVAYENSDVFAVGNHAMFNARTSRRFFDAQRGSNYKKIL